MNKKKQAKNPRLESLRKLCEDYHIEIKKDHFRTTAEDDIAPYFTDPPTETVDCPWAAVTKGYADHVIHYITLHAQRNYAIGSAEINVNDPIYPEWPVEVRNLDTGETWFPSEPEYEWKEVKR